MSGVTDDTRRRASRNGFRQSRPSVLPRSAMMCLALVAVVIPNVGVLSAQVDAAAQVDQADQVDEPLSDVRVDGNVTIPDYAILRHVKSSANRPVNHQQVREDVRQLYATRWFLSVEPRYRQTDDGTVLTFKVVERPIVRSVKFVGNHKIKDKHLRAWTGLEVGSPFDVNANRQSVNRIIDRYKEKGYNEVKVDLVKGGDQDDREVVFEIKEGVIARVAQRVPHGVKWVSAARLKTQLVTKQIYAGVPFGGVYDPTTVEADVEAIKQYYKKFGFLDIAVRTETKFSKDRSRVRIDYFITEGPRFKIRNLSIDGNQVIPTQELMAGFKLQEGDYFETAKISSDVSRMSAMYGKLGRLMAQVDAVPRYLEEEGMVDLVYKVNEDQVNYVRNINVIFDGDYPHTKRTVVLDRSLINPGDLADPLMISKTKRRLAGTGLFEQGPGGVRIDVKPVVQMAGLPDDGTFRGQAPGESSRTKRPYGLPQPITPGIIPGHTAGRVSFPKRTNTSRTRQRSYRVNSPIKSETRLPKAPRSASRTQLSPASNETTSSIYQPVSEHTVFQQSTDTIFRAQNFDGPFRTPNNPIYDNSPLGDPFGRSIREPPPGWVDLNIYATEARTGRMMFGVGVNSDAGVVGNIVIDESNFDILNGPRNWSDVIDGRAWRGGGQRFRIEAVPGNEVSRYMVNWSDPYFLHSDYSLGVSGFYFNRFYEDWRENRLGGRVSVGKQLDPFWSISSAFRFEDVELTDPRIPTPPALAESLGTNTLITGQVAVTHDTRDASILPGAGHFAQVSYEQAFGDYDYPRFEGEFRQYFTTFKRPDESGRQVLTLSGNVGWSGDDTPIFERFYAGGFQTFRGFSFRGVSPRDQGVAIGGMFSFLGSAEYRVPVTANDMIQIVGFTDFGTVEEDTSFDNFRLTVGAGLRLTIPQMGPVPLAFDFAFPILKQDFDETQVFSFYVGINR
jgi:outer membrane protein insertion porin family